MRRISWDNESTQSQWTHVCSSYLVFVRRSWPKRRLLVRRAKEKEANSESPRLTPRTSPTQTLQWSKTSCSSRWIGGCVLSRWTALIASRQSKMSSSLEVHSFWGPNVGSPWSNCWECLVHSVSDWHRSLLAGWYDMKNQTWSDDQTHLWLIHGKPRSDLMRFSAVAQRSAQPFSFVWLRVDLGGEDHRRWNGGEAQWVCQLVPCSCPGSVQPWPRTTKELHLLWRWRSPWSYCWGRAMVRVRVGPSLTVTSWGGFETG